MSDHYIKTTHNGYRLKIQADYLDSGLIELCCHKQIDEGLNCQRVQSSVHACVYKIVFQNQEYYYKIFCQRSKYESLKNYFFGSRAARGLRGHLILRQNGFGAPKVIMIGHRNRHDFMVSESVKDSVNLYQYVDKITKSTESDFRQKKLEIIEEMGELIGKMHAEKIIHGDLRWGNLLIAKNNKGNNSFWFIDNERTYKYPILPSVRRLRNLVQLNMTINIRITRSDRLRFLERYLQENPRIKSAKKKWIRMIADKTVRRLKRKTSIKEQVCR